MKIETYQETIQDQETTTSNPFNSSYLPVQKGNYALISTEIYNYIWESALAFWAERASKDHNFIEEISEGCFKFNLGTSYGIHSYQLVYPTFKEQK